MTKPEKCWKWDGPFPLVFDAGEIRGGFLTVAGPEFALALNGEPMNCVMGNVWHSKNVRAGANEVSAPGGHLPCEATLTLYSGVDGGPV